MCMQPCSCDRPWRRKSFGTQKLLGMANGVVNFHSRTPTGVWHWVSIVSAGSFWSKIDGKKDTIVVIERYEKQNGGIMLRAVRH